MDVLQQLKPMNWGKIVVLKHKKVFFPHFSPCFSYFCSMTTTTIILLFLFSIGAAFIQRVSGFGFGIFIMTVLPYLMPSYGESTTLSGLLASVTSLFIVIKMWRYIHWRRLLPVLATFWIVSFFAVQCISLVGDGTLKRVLGVVLILVSAYLYFFSKKVKVKATLPVQITAGTLSGLMGGFFGMQGPPVVPYFLASEPTKEGYIAIAQCYFLLGNLGMTLYRANSGFLTPAVGQAWCYGLVAVLIGTYTGNIVFQRISAETLRRIVYLYMAVCGVIAILS